MQNNEGLRNRESLVLFNLELFLLTVYNDVVTNSPTPYIVSTTDSQKKGGEAEKAWLK